MGQSCFLNELGLNGSNPTPPIIEVTFFTESLALDKISLFEMNFAHLSI
jgi:hypothetical protein